MNNLQLHIYRLGILWFYETESKVNEKNKMKTEDLSQEELALIEGINIVGENGYVCGEVVVIDSLTGIAYLRNNEFEAGFVTIYTEFGKFSLETLSHRELFHRRTRFEEGFGKTNWNVTLADWSAFLSSKIMDGTLSVGGLE